jgi:hypothetical protein
MDKLADFNAFKFEHAGRERPVFRKGSGPAVLVMHEVPGISAEVLRFARKVVDAGFTVFMPHLFGGRGVGAVGMCVTGNFALTLTLDPWVIAPVLAHPSFPLPITPAKASAVHATVETMENARRRIRDEDLKVLGIRFDTDILFCRAARFETLRRELGHGFEGIELPGSSSAPHPEPPHSVLTVGLVDRTGEPTRAAVDRVISFLSERLSIERNSRL